MLKGGVQLPDDVVSIGYKKVSSFQFAQVFYSDSLNFTGTEQEFIDAGHAYKFVKIDENRRFTV